MLVLGSELVDLVWGAFLLIGAEQVRIEPGATAVNPLRFINYPITHSLLGTLTWALLLGLLYLRFHRRLRGPLVVFGLVLSHWCLDVVSHVRDVPVLWDGPYLGFGLWQSLPATIGVEVGLLLAGAFLYARQTWALDGAGLYGFLALLVLLVAVQFAGWFGPPPPDPRVVAWTTLLCWGFVVWALLLDRHREVRYGEADVAPGPRRQSDRTA